MRIFKYFFYFLCLSLLMFLAFGEGKKYGKGHKIVIHTSEEKAGVYAWMVAKSEMPENVLHNIYKITMQYDNADLILAIIKAESNFNPFVKSHKNAMGLMGIVPKWWLDELIKNKIIKNKRDLYDIEKNIKAGNYVLSKYFESCKDINIVLSKYSGNSKHYPQKVFVALGEINYARMKGKW